MTKRKVRVQPNRLSVGSGEESSRFVIDLQKKSNKVKNSKTSLLLENTIKKRQTIDMPGFKSCLKSSKAKKLYLGRKIKSIFKNKKVEDVKKPSFIFFHKLLKKNHENIKRIKQLAIFSFFIFIFRALGKVLSPLNKFFYIVGWYSVFISRFIYFFNVKLFGFIFKQFKVASKTLKYFIKQGVWLVSKNINFNFKPRNKFSDSEKIEDYAVQQASEKEVNLFEEVFAPIDSTTSNFKLRGAVSFAVVLLAVILPFKAFTYYKDFNVEDLKGSILGASESAISEFLSASDMAGSFDFKSASSNFSKAGDNFLEAQSELDNINGAFLTIAGIIPNDELRLASESKDILRAGEIASSLGQKLSMIGDSLFNYSGDDVFDILKNISTYGDGALADSENLNIVLRRIDESVLPSEIKNKFIDLRDKADALEVRLSDFRELLANLKIFLGEKEKKRYLLVFQNNAELRASGGFIGSFALIDFNKGEIQNLEVPKGGSYDTEGGMRVSVTAPEPLHLVNPLWHFWDANWWPDWPKTSQKLMWFYEKSDGPSVDGVIGFTPTVLEKLLKIIGPIDMREEYGVILDSDNFWLTIQSIVEQEEETSYNDDYVEDRKEISVDSANSPQKSSEEENEPKKIIGDLMKAILDELPRKLNKENLVDILKLVEESLSQKHVLFYFNDDKLQNEIEEYGWDGRIKDTKWDYLSVINTNIAGGKSDLKMAEEIKHTSEVLDDGSIINEVEIKRTHTGVRNEPFSGVRNVDWMRIYVPVGSELLEADGFRTPDEIYFEDPDPLWEKDLSLRNETNSFVHEPSKTKIYNESGKTVFANWSMVDPGETTTIYLKYKLPFKLEKRFTPINLENDIDDQDEKEFYPYALFVQKQAGAKPSKFSSSLELPIGIVTRWQFPEEFAEAGGGWEINNELDTDKYWAILLEKLY